MSDVDSRRCVLLPWGVRVVALCRSALARRKVETYVQVEELESATLELSRRTQKAL